MANNGGMISLLLDGAFGSASDIISEAFTIKPDMSRETINERAKDRTGLKLSINDINSFYKSTLDADGNLIPDPNFEKEEWITEGGEARNGIQDLQDMFDAQDILEGELEPSYDELSYDNNFLQKARKVYKAENGIDWQGTPKELTEHMFSKFNYMELNVGWTGLKLVSDNMFYDDFSPEDIQATAEAYEMFKEANWTGDGSRDFALQAKDLIKGTAADPLSWAFFNKKALQFGSNSAKLLAKKAFQSTISDRMAVMAGSAVTTAGFGASMNVNTQTIEQDLGIKDDFSVPELALATSISAAFPVAITGVGALPSYVSGKVNNLLARHTNLQQFSSPIISKDVSQAVGNIQRAIFHPFQARYGKNMVDENAGTMKGKTSAMVGVMSDVRDAAIAKSSKVSVKEFTSSLNDHVINPMTSAIKRGYEALRYRDVTKVDLKPINEALDEVRRVQANNTEFNKVLDNGLIADLLKILNPVSKQSADDYALIVQQVADRNSKSLAEWNILVREFAENLERPVVLRKNLPIVPAYVAEKVPEKIGIEYLKATTTNEAGEIIATKDISEVFKKLKQSLYNASQDAFKKGDSATGQALKEFRLVVNASQRNQLAGKGDKSLYDSLQKTNEDFKTALSETSIGRHFAVILEKTKMANYHRSKRNAEGQLDPSVDLARALDEETNIAVKRLLEDIIDTKDSLPRLKQFENILNALDYRTNRVNNAMSLRGLGDLETKMFTLLVQKNFKEFPELEKLVDLAPRIRDRAIKKLATEKLTVTGNESYPALRQIIASRFGENLKTDLANDTGLVYLGKILDREDGFELVQHIFPDFAPQLAQIKSLDKFLKNKVLAKHSQSVIVNMTFASLAMETGMMVGGGGMAGKLAAGAATLTTMGGLQGWRNLIGNRKFQIQMVNILNNDGRISTKTASKLEEQFGFDAAGIRQLQDELNNMLITRSVIRTQDDGKDTANKMVE